MFTAKIEGLRLLKDGSASVMLTCSGADLQAIANLRQGNITCYGESEKPVVDNRLVILTNLHSLAEQIADTIERELSQEVIEQLEMGVGDGDI